MAKTDESNYDLTTNTSSANKYDSKGVEIESSYRMGNFRLNGGFTFTDATVKDSDNAAYVGRAPNRQAKLIYQLSPSYSWAATTVGATIVGTTKSLDAQTTALQAELPAYTYVNAFARYEVNASTSVNLGVNNLFNTIGYTEVNSDRAAARSINGRTVNLSLRHNF
jgi:outer membrane receptor protein involved in Fe transport